MRLGSEVKELFCLLLFFVIMGEGRGRGHDFSRSETGHSTQLFLSFFLSKTTSKQGRPKLPKIIARRRFREREERVYRVFFPSALFCSCKSNLEQYVY